MTEPAAAAAPAAPSGTSPTMVTQAQPTAYQTASPAAAAPAASTEGNTPATSTTAPAGTTPPVSTTPAAPTEGSPSPDPATPPAGEPAKAAEPAASDFKLPDEYKDKSWAAKVKTQDDLYKQLDNLTTLVGKKTVIPNLKDASPEEREAFYSQLRGKDATEYVIPVNEAFPTPPETQPVVAKLFMDNGVSPVQAEAIIKGYQDLGAKQLAAQFDPEVMKASMQTAFGDKWEPTIASIRNSISTMMSPEDAKALDNIPNNILGTVYRTLGNTINAVNETLKKYGATETFAHLTAPNGQAKGGDLTATRQGIRDQMTALRDRPHNSEEYNALQQKLADTYTNDPRINQAS